MNSTELDELAELVRGMVASTVTAAGPDHRAAWNLLAENGFTLVSIDERAGGSGGDLAAAAAILGATASVGLSLPLPETAWLAGWFLSGRGVTVPDEPLAAVVAKPDLSVVPAGSELRLSGELPVPWLGFASRVLVIAPHAGVAALIPVDPTGTPNAPGIPSGRLTLSSVSVDAGWWWALPDGFMREWDLRLCAARTVQLAAAAAAVLAISIEHATQRHQFGRPLSANQVIAHYLARMAAAVREIQVARDSAVQSFVGAPGSAAVVRAAKLVASQATEEITALAHQICGAMGTTREHPLHRLTMNMWTWRDDAGDEYDQADHLATLTRDHDLWTYLTDEIGATDEEIRSA